MRQEATRLPPGVPMGTGCQPGHTPQLVRTAGAPQGHRIGTPCPETWHIECARCQRATQPHPSRAITELRWTDATLSAQLIPLSQLGQARNRVLADLRHAA
ncbi:hypothetical protein EA662_17510 [Pseudoxanthomonas winnipegensis]|nr:hypothetical protein EA662_17510 [Pseudoxanthomonas winnipegensis]